MATKLGPERLKELREALVAKRRQLEDEVGRSVALREGPRRRHDQGPRRPGQHRVHARVPVRAGQRRPAAPARGADRAPEARRGRLRRVRAVRGADRREAPRRPPVRALLHRVPAAPRARGQGRRRLSPARAPGGPTMALGLAAGSIRSSISSSRPSARSASPARTIPPTGPFCGPCWAALPVGLGPGCPVCGEPFPGLGGALPCDACRRRAAALRVRPRRRRVPGRDAGGDPRAEVRGPARPGDAARAAPGRGRGPGALPAPPSGLGGGPRPGAAPSGAARGARVQPGGAPGRARAAARWRVPVLARALVRSRATLPQTDLDPAARRANVRDAFRVPRPAAVRGPARSCSSTTSSPRARPSAPRPSALRAAGAAAVGVLTLARVVRR